MPGEFGPERAQPIAQGGFGLGRLDDTQRPGDDGRVRDVLVPLGADQRTFAVAIVGGEEAVELRDVDPFQEVRVVGGVRPTIGGGADDSIVDSMHRVDRSLRL